MAGDQVGATVVLLIVIFIGVAIIWAIYSNAQERARQRKQRLETIQREAEGFLRRVEQEKVLPSTPVHIVLQKGEIGVLQETSTLSEARSYRVYAGGGTRIKGVYIGGGTSESHQRLTQIDSGSLVLTNQRL